MLRGLHIQNPNPCGQACYGSQSGAVLDAAVDARVSSPTFGRHVAVELSQDEKTGASSGSRAASRTDLSSARERGLLLQCDDYYSPSDEQVVKWDDAEPRNRLGCASPQLSQRDQNGTPLAQLQRKVAQT